MVAIVLDRTFVNLVSTGDVVKAFTGRGRSRNYRTDGAVQGFAGGRFRSIALEGVAGQQTFMLRDVSLADIDTLKSWIGETVLVRDNRGRRMFGTYFEVGYNDRMDSNYYDVTLNVVEVSYQEGA
jgi:hypothetical protein